MNTILYISIILTGLPLRVISAIAYWIPFSFRHKVLEFMNTRIEEDGEFRVLKHKPGFKKWKLYLHPYFWMFTLTTGLTVNYSGHYWFLRKKKEKWFPWLSMPYALLEDKANDLLDRCWPSEKKTWKQSLQYFYLCYRWQGLRNSHWAFNEWFFQEGKWKEGTEKVSYCRPLEGSIYKYWDITPQLKWDEGNDMGKVLRFQTIDTPQNEIWQCTHEGKKKITFTTHKGHKRFMYAFCKVTTLFSKQLIIEHQFGWNWWNGIPVFHFKHILRKSA